MRSAHVGTALVVFVAAALSAQPCGARVPPAVLMGRTPESLVARSEAVALFEVVKGNVTPETVFEAPKDAPLDFDFHVRPTVTLRVIRPLKDCKIGDVFEITGMSSAHAPDYMSVPATRPRPRPPIFLSDGEQVLGYVRGRPGEYSADVTPVRDGKLEIGFYEERSDRQGRGYTFGTRNLPLPEALEVVAGAVGKWKEAQAYDAARMDSAQLIDRYGDNEWVNERVIDELVARADAKALGTLLDRATDTQKLRVAQALAEVPGAGPVPYLVRLLDSPHRVLMSEAVQGLARPEAKAAVPALIGVMERKEPTNFVPLSLHTIVETLVAIGDPRGIEAALAAAADPHRSKERDGVIRALAPLLPNPDVKAFLLTQLRDPVVVGAATVEDKHRYQREIMFAAAKALAKSGSDAGFNRLMELVREERRKKFPENMVVALGEVGDKRAVPLLLEMLASAGVDYQWNVTAGALVRIRDERAIQPLINLVRRTKGDDRGALIGMIGEWDHPKIREMLTAEVRGSDPRPICAAALVLHKYGVAEGADRLLALLAKGVHGWTRYERYSLYTTLGAMRERRAIPGLIAAMAADKENRDDIANVLRLISGAELPADAEAWRKWWQENRE